jgi:hypothetical protein
MTKEKTLLRDIYVELAEAKKALDAKRHAGGETLHAFFQLFGPRIRESLGCEDAAAVRAWKPVEPSVLPPQRDLDPESKRVLYGNMRELMEKSEPTPKHEWKYAGYSLLTEPTIPAHRCERCGTVDESGIPPDGPCAALNRQAEPSGDDPLDSREFYEVMQTYRWAGMTPQLAEQKPATEAFGAVKAWLRRQLNRTPPHE